MSYSTPLPDVLQYTVTGCPTVHRYRMSYSTLLPVDEVSYFLGPSLYFELSQMTTYGIFYQG